MSAKPVFSTSPVMEYLFLGVQMRIIIDADDTNKTLSVVEGNMPPTGDGGLHVHHEDDETMFILDGTLEVTIGDVTQVLAAGSAFFAPRGIPHRIRNIGGRPSRSLVISSPGSFSSFIKNAAIKIDENGYFPTPGPDYMAKVGAAAEAHGIQMLGLPDQ